MSNEVSDAEKALYIQAGKACKPVKTKGTGRMGVKRKNQEAYKTGYVDGAKWLIAEAKKKAFQVHLVHSISVRAVTIDDLQKLGGESE